MALRVIYLCLALTVLITSGCRTRSNYQPVFPPRVVAVTPAPAPAPCPNPPPPPGPVSPPPGVFR